MGVFGLADFSADWGTENGPGWKLRALTTMVVNGQFFTAP
jgi:hypothetical protein